MPRKQKGKKAAAKDKRSAERWHLVFYLRVFEGQSNRILGHLVDISATGLMLASDEAITVGKDYQLRMRLPKEFSGRVEILLEAKSLWCRKDENPDFHLAGFRIDGLAPDLAIHIKQLVDDFSIEQSLKASDLERPACNLTHTTGG